MITNVNYDYECKKYDYECKRYDYGCKSMITSVKSMITGVKSIITSVKSFILQATSGAKDLQEIVADKSGKLGLFVFPRKFLESSYKKLTVKTYDDKLTIKNLRPNRETKHWGTFVA
jgi:hypothetical protein